MTVLILTRTDDNDCVPAVVEALRRRGAQVVRFDTDRFPTEIRLAVRYDGPRELAQLIAPEGAVDLAEVSAVWHRRLAFGRRISMELEPQLRNACIQESRATAMGLIASLGAFHLDREVDIRFAQHKQLQLRVARELGLETLREPIGKEDLVRVEEAFLTGSTRGILPVVAVEERVLGSGRPGPWTTRLSRAYLDHARRCARTALEP